jgi:hypothetical protein
MLKSLSVFIISVLILIPAFSVTYAAPAQVMEDYVCNPANTNFIFRNFSGSTIYPGNSGYLFFRLNNPYNETMQNLNITAEIYAWADLENHRYIDERFHSPPTIEQGNGRIYSDHPGDILPGMNITYNLTLNTKENTPEGSYYVRFTIEFDYSNSSNSSDSSAKHFIMRSMSYYTKNQWDYAVKNATESDLPYYHHGVNITYLSQFYPVDAIIPFTSFSVHRGVPKWPLFLFGGGTIFFAWLAYMYYMNDNYGKYQWLDEKTKQVSGKYQKFRRGLYERARKK